MQLVVRLEPRHASNVNSLPSRNVRRLLSAKSRKPESEGIANWRSSANARHRTRPRACSENKKQRLRFYILVRWYLRIIPRKRSTRSTRRS